MLLLFSTCRLSKCKSARLNSCLGCVTSSRFLKALCFLTSREQLLARVHVGRRGVAVVGFNFFLTCLLYASEHTSVSQHFAVNPCSSARVPGCPSCSHTPYSRTRGVEAEPPAGLARPAQTSLTLRARSVSAGTAGVEACARKSRVPSPQTSVAGFPHLNLCTRRYVVLSVS